MKLNMPLPRDTIYFVGSLPLKDGETVFRDISRELGPYLARIPDGETGERIKWIVFQQRMLNAHPAMEVDPTEPPLPVRQSDGTVFREIRRLRIKPEFDVDKIHFDTNYDRAALESYNDFERLSADGTIPAKVRFQFALPTPMATGLQYISPNGRERYLWIYESALLSALKNIVDGIPHDKLSLQFDVCQEVLMWENYYPQRDPDYKEATFRQFARLAAAVPSGVELGFHFCYGSPGDQPLISLKDASVLVEMMNGIDEFVRRPVQFSHIPVPRNADDAFFGPLAKWRNTKGTHLYLGLLQYNDPQGDERRIKGARRVLKDFGVGAECGFGRTDPARVPNILAGHRRIAEFIQRTL